MAVAAILAALVSVVTGVAALSGFGGSGSGDLVASPSSPSTVLLLVGGLVLIELELARMGRRRPARRSAASEAVRA
jgi:hypothetical protein